MLQGQHRAPRVPRDGVQECGATLWALNIRDLTENPVSHPADELLAGGVACRQVDHRVVQRGMPATQRQPELWRIYDPVVPHTLRVAAVDGHRLRQHSDVAAERMAHHKVVVQRHDISRDTTVVREAAVHDRIGLDEVPLDQGLQAQVIAPDDRREVLFLDPAVFPDRSHGMEAHRCLWMPVEERHLFAQLQRIDPVVVALTQCDVRAASF